MTPLRDIVVVGHGSAAYLSALTLARAAQGLGLRITVVDLASAAGDSAVLGEAEATFPPLRAFHGLLGLSEAQLGDFARASPWLGLQMCGWGHDPDAEASRAGFVQSLGETGASLNTVAFQQFLSWLRLTGRPSAFERYNLGARAARAGKFQPPSPDARSILSTYAYGLTIEVAAYARGLRALAASAGVRLTSAGSIEVALDPASEHRIAAVRLDGGETIAGDLFIDASGAAAVLARRTLQARFEPVSALTAASLVSVRLATPAAQAMNRCDALPGGYLLSLGLADGQVLSLVHDPAQLDVTDASATLAAIPGARDLRKTGFTQGRLTQAWVGNCIAIGAAAGVLEPLNVSGLHQVQSGLTRLIGLFPDRNLYPSLRDEYNRLTGEAFDRQRDIVLATYALSGSLDRDAWPESLARKIEQFRSRGRVALLDGETFTEAQWVNLFLGLGLDPERYDPMIDSLDKAKINRQLSAMAAQVAQATDAMPPFRAAHPMTQAARR